MNNRLRIVLLGIFLVIFLVLFHHPLLELFALSSHDELFSHVPLIPLVSVFLVFSNRKDVFRKPGVSLSIGIPLLAISAFLLIIGEWLQPGLTRNDYLSLAILSLVAFTAGVFSLLSGAESTRRALFPILFLLFMVPLPGFLMERVIKFLQYSSANGANILFHLMGIKFSREGSLLFHFPGLNIIVAEECSGIRSSMALLITSVLAAHMFLKKGVSKVLLVFAAIPMAIFKNSLRIATLSLLALKIDPNFVGGNPLHRRGGIVFFLVALVSLGMILAGLRWLERRGNSSAENPET